MIFDEIVVHNFGVYKGRQTVPLSPPASTKPVVLFGGINGAGKTTLLDALQLALYGKFAQCHNRGSLGYEEFLRQSIHRTVDPKEGAAIELQFRHVVDGKEKTYRIHRNWFSNGKGIREMVEVIRDGQLDPVLTDAWNEHVEEFIPVRISHLFFFDGENIESLADIDNSAALLSTAIHSLLGLDIIDRLSTDLAVLERRKRTALKKDEGLQKIESLQRRVDDLDSLCGELTAKKARIRNEVDRWEKKLNEVETQFREEGGELYSRRESVELERQGASRRLRDVEDELRDLAAGALPLILVQKYLSRIDKQDAKEKLSAEAESLAKVLAERDKKVVRHAQGSGISKKQLAALKEYLAKDRSQLAKKSKTDRYLRLSDDSREHLHSLQREVLEEARSRAQRLVQSAEELQSKLVEIDRRIAGIPHHEKIAKIVEQLESVRASTEATKRQLEVAELELERATRDRDREKAKLAKLIEAKVRSEFDSEDASRIILYSQKVRDTLDVFRTRVTQRYVSRIEKLVLDSLHQLLRKEALVSSLTIDPITFALELRGSDGKVLPPDRLSAGERQLLAVSMLWGLGKASGRPLPAVIDTPLGRLDASHRTHMVERYFPYASHQVLLFSTDEEIDEKYYDKLRRWVGHEYTLDFNDREESTRFEQGYFWRGN